MPENLYRFKTNLKNYIFPEIGYEKCTSGIAGFITTDPRTKAGPNARRKSYPGFEGKCRKKDTK